MSGDQYTWPFNVVQLVQQSVTRIMRVVLITANNAPTGAAHLMDLLHSDQTSNIIQIVIYDIYEYMVCYYILYNKILYIYNKIVLDIILPLAYVTRIIVAHIGGSYMQHTHSVHVHVLYRHIALGNCVGNIAG